MSALSVVTVPEKLNSRVPKLSRLVRWKTQLALYRKYVLCEPCFSIARFTCSHRWRYLGDASSGISSRPTLRSGKQSNAISTQRFMTEFYCTAPRERNTDRARQGDRGRGRQGVFYWLLRAPLSLCLLVPSSFIPPPPPPLPDSPLPPSFPSRGESRRRRTRLRRAAADRPWPTRP